MKTEGHMDREENKNGHWIKIQFTVGMYNLKSASNVKA